MKKKANESPKKHPKSTSQERTWIPLSPSTAEERRKRLDVIARLANIKLLSALPDWEKLQLVEQVRQARFDSVEGGQRLQAVHRGERDVWTEPILGGAVHSECAPDLFLSWGLKEDVPFEWEAILRAHPHVWEFVNRLLDGRGSVDLEFFAPLEATLVNFHEPSGRLVHASPIDVMKYGILLPLGRVLRQSFFPFRRCSVCTVVFVPGKNQKYCSPACTIRGGASARKEERRGYMREYMARKRAEGKKQRGARQRVK